MSSVIKANEWQAATGSTVSIPSGTTLEVASGATLTNSGSATGFGKVLQVVTWSYGTHTTYSAQTTTWTAMPDIAASITPTSTSSKILVNMSLSLSCDSYSAHRFTRDGTEILVGSVSSSNTVASFGGNGYISDTGGAWNVSYFDSPSTTSAVEYSMNYLTPWSAGGIIYINRGTDGNSYRNTGYSFMTLMEIAG